MLDTEQKIDQFLAELRVELMSSQKEPGSYGPEVIIEQVSNARLTSLSTKAFGPIKKVVSITIYQKSVKTIAFHDLDELNRYASEQELPIVVFDQLP